MLRLTSALFVFSVVVSAAVPAYARRPMVSHAAYVTVSDGITTKRVRKPVIHHYTNKASVTHTTVTADASGCYEVASTGALVPCRPHGR